MANRYYYLNRPPAYAHQPEGHTAWEGGLPAKYWFTTDGARIYSFGWVEYPEPLPLDRVWQFDLLPDNMVERAHYHYWQEAERDPDLARELEIEAVNALMTDPTTFHQYYDAVVIALTQALLDAQRSEE